ncbi:hypothetical protein NIES4103_38170 [Nostoc sp. NIES-4103]|nr:hypothetical protein NIES4103_38170 [Nostoc sp. NIES-4103]
MHLRNISAQPIHHFNVASVCPGGSGFEWIDIPLLSAVSDDLPDSLDAILIAGDLQAIDNPFVPVEERRLAGEAIAEQLVTLAESQLIPQLNNTGVLLTGDLYTDPTLKKRGQTGNVLSVWNSFAQSFRWVVGVAGNHDLFDKQAISLWKPQLIHGTAISKDGLCIAGISGIVGNSNKPWRVPQKQHAKWLKELLGQSPDILLFHEGPSSPDETRPGNASILKQLNKLRYTSLVVSGHVHWRHPLSGEPPSLQVLNVDSRIVLVTREPIEALKL